MADKEAKPLKKDLPVADQARIGRILDSDPELLSSADKDFIMSRRDYLTADEAKAVGIDAKSIKTWSDANAADATEDVDEDEDDDV